MALSIFKFNNSIWPPNRKCKFGLVLFDKKSTEISLYNVIDCEESNATVNCQLWQITMVAKQEIHV